MKLKLVFLIFIASIGFCNIGFSQNVLGWIWARLKYENFVAEFNTWLINNGHNPRMATDALRREFIRNHDTKNDPFLAYRDTKGKIRIYDGHHAFWARNRFMEGKDFDFFLKINKDYQQVNPATGKPWTQKEMVNDLHAKNRLTIYGKKVPTVKEFKKIPQKIEDLQDVPMRSYVSLAFTKVDVKYEKVDGTKVESHMKGSDFIPMIQFLVEAEMSPRFIRKVERATEPEAIDLVYDKLFLEKQYVQFLLDSLKTKDSPRQRKIRSILEDFLAKAEAPSAS